MYSGWKSRTTTRPDWPWSSVERHAHSRHIQDAPTTFSFEFFPPKTDHASKELFATIAHLQALQPSFVSVTYGAGGSTRERTHDLVVRIQRETMLTAVSHLTCVCHNQDEIAAILDRYAESAIEKSLPWAATRPRNMPDYDRSRDAFQYADQLVGFVRAHRGSPDSRGFGIGVAGFPEGHPSTPNRLKEMDYLKGKVDAGADYICTQLYFSNFDFYDFRERCDLAGIRVPIIAGIMPITSKENLIRMAELALGARARETTSFRRPLRKRSPVRRQGRHPLGDRAVPRPARQPGPRHPFLHPQPLGRDAADLRKPWRERLRLARRSPGRCSLSREVTHQGHGRRPPARGA